MYQYKAKVIQVVDGNTVILDIDLGFGIIMTDQNCQLFGIATPELRDKDPVLREAALVAKNFLVSKVEGKTLLIDTIKDRDDKYGRMLVTLRSEEDRVPWNQVMIELGYAVAYFGESRRLHR